MIGMAAFADHECAATTPVRGRQGQHFTDIGQGPHRTTGSGLSASLRQDHVGVGGQCIGPRVRCGSIVILMCW